MERKLKKGENFLVLIPARNPEISFKEKDGIVTLVVPNVGFFNKIAQTFFQRPEKSYIKLDQFSSFIWLNINGKRDVEKLGRLLKNRFGDKAEPLYPRLVKFLTILKDNRYIGLKDPDGTIIR